MTTQTQFRQFLNDVEPSQTTKQRASEAHTSLRKYLRAHETFKKVHLNTFLSGSYVRDTAIRPQVRDGFEERPDVDIIVVTDHSLNDDPNEVLTVLHQILNEKYDNTRKQSRSIGIETATVDMDVVPIIAPQGIDETLYIPDRKLSIG